MCSIFLGFALLCKNEIISWLNGPYRHRFCFVHFNSQPVTATECFQNIKCCSIASALYNNSKILSTYKSYIIE